MEGEDLRLSGAARKKRVREADEMEEKGKRLSRKVEKTKKKKGWTEEKNEEIIRKKKWKLILNEERKRHLQREGNDEMGKENKEKQRLQVMEWKGGGGGGERCKERNFE